VNHAVKRVYRLKLVKDFTAFCKCGGLSMDESTLLERGSKFSIAVEAKLSM